MGPDLLASQIPSKADKDRPWLVWYGPGGERVELTGHVAAMWVCKAAGLLEEQTWPGSAVHVGGATHWRTVLWCAGAWWAGREVVLGRAGTVSRAVDAGVVEVGLSVALIPDDLAQAELQVLLPSSPLAALETANWNAMIDVNIKGVLNGIAAVLPEFTAQKHGHVITTSSVAGLKIYPGAAVYCGTKWAVRAIMESLRMESAQAGTNIRTATIYPAAVQSELVSHITDENASKGYRQLYDTYEIPAARVAAVVAFALAQPDDTNISEFTIGPTTQPW